VLSSDVVRIRFLLLVSMSVAAYGCLLDWTVPADTGPKGDDGLDASADALGSDAPAFEDGSKTLPESEPPVTSACRQSSECPPDAPLCVFAAFDCGDTSVGSCVKPPMPQDVTCPANGFYCACDGQVYENACMPLAEGIDLSLSHCKNDQTTAGAGYAWCVNGSVAVVDPSEPRYRQYRCEPVPNGCDGGDCNCLGPKFCSASSTSGGPTGTAKCQNGVVTCF
jgi:hypothetical protein